MCELRLLVTSVILLLNFINSSYLLREDAQFHNDRVTIIGINIRFILIIIFIFFQI